MLASDCIDDVRDSNDGSGKFLLIFALAFILLLSISFIAANSHSIERHGNDALLVEACVNNGGTMEQWWNPNTKRSASICGLPDGRFGILVCEEDGNVVTCFIKDKMKRLEQVYNYLKNRGYEP